MIDHPIALFTKWFNEELKLSKVRIPTAVCLSTMGTDNFPNARFVSFKEILDNSFIVTGPINSRKGVEIARNKNVSLTFWWTETERQIRIQGVATKISDELADKYFNERSIPSKAVASVCEQGKETGEITLLEEEVQNRISENAEIKRPENWSGYSIHPIRIEFMEFKKTRFHDRKLYKNTHGKWNMSQIQP